MTSKTITITSLIITIVAGSAAIGRSQVKVASWLDEAKPASWNKPGVTIPAAPKIQGALDPRCREAARPPQLEQDKQLRDHGWDLVGAYQGGWDIVVIRATAGYDGMCRPRQYQEFVFVRGMFAGTLSPQAMDSRADGALTRVSLQSSSRLTAEYDRYAATDPLCCPSRTTTVVLDLSNNPPVLQPVSASSTGRVASASAATIKPLEGTYWRAIALAGKLTPAQDPKREAHLQFQAGNRVSGSDGCNRVTGRYELKGDRVTFRQMAGTQMACLKLSGTEQPFREALKSATRLIIAGDRLDLLDAQGVQVASFAAGAQAAAPSPAAGLAGTSWQLVKFQGSDDTTLTPADRAKYVIEFGAAGRLTARIDCNRGRGTWKSGGPSQLQFGPLALTRAKCPTGSLHDQIVKQWGNIRSYVQRDGHLFLALMADGGIYEFEPVVANPK